MKKRLGDFGGRLPPEGHWDQERHLPAEGTPSTPIPPELAAMAQIANDAVDRLINWYRCNNLNTQDPVHQSPTCQCVPQLFASIKLGVPLPAGGGFRPVVIVTSAADNYIVVNRIGLDLSVAASIGIVDWRFTLNGSPLETYENFSALYGTIPLPQEIKVMVPPNGNFTIWGSNPPLSPAVNAFGVAHCWRFSDTAPLGSPSSVRKC